ncbi:MAG: Hpt domain-containing protein [Methyloversatilis sp.]|uniref:Hpt domain-containing protein n=1 Tax=Methyloversatilis sp. TaxID=2569862 RepID=UPI00273563FC|nr:Hpt domain-containing protein [Methyloversatilis sp.]MDP3871959.1 Hpt domain-containing protein [Methyloversatilis sp.]
MNVRIPPQQDDVAVLPDAGAMLDLRILFSVPGMRENRAGLRTRVLATWRNEAAAIIDALRDAAAAGDAHALRLAAHRLKSSSGALGAIYISNLAIGMENAARDGRIAFDGQLRLRLEQAVQQTLAAFGALDDPSGGDPGLCT